ncbi:MAG TPA: peptide-methionine (R)-S-oxide reductase MsrB [Alphaproteobacteria bacterium]|nr:peptide-methionine (R)-S-oxide reductase MsrB [Alphaproteobacteria bacterium]
MKDTNSKMEKQMKNLTEQQKHILFEKGTEAPFTGEYVHTKDKGMYKCAYCGNALFSSDTKFDSGTGWPSFTEPANLKNIELKEDKSLFMTRTEVLCKKCGGHLGHVFDDGPNGKQRYCINSCSLKLHKEENKNDKKNR